MKAKNYYVWERTFQNYAEPAICAPLAMLGRGRRARRALLAVTCERRAGPRECRGGPRGVFDSLTTTSVFSSGTAPVSLRRASLPRDNRERIVPTGTSRTAATSS